MPFPLLVSGVREMADADYHEGEDRKVHGAPSGGSGDLPLQQHVPVVGGPDLDRRDVVDGDVDGARGVHGVAGTRLPAGDERGVPSCEVAVRT